ncbi:hypothetical protein [Aureispira anguillae]|uniref:Uncharacterized protein n=1 Tax=Aureispira anguillae TaxID=2864201 RepID=A0A915YGH9_9BACT|nr:hypothetical protein [Aureispira anguillae]BDS12668.1 hypothetical protein AsAng_0033920 [Aureispira anguillae]
MNKLIQKLSGKQILLLFIITNLVYAFMLLVTIPKTLAFSEGIKILDMMPMGYDAAYIHTLLETLGEKGRSVYLYQQVPVDLIYPFLFGFCYSALIIYWLKQLNLFQSSFRWLSYLPMLAGAFDYCENVGIITLLSSYPDLSMTVMSITNIATIVKSITTVISFFALILLLILLGIKKVKSNA